MERLTKEQITKLYLEQLKENLKLKSQIAQLENELMRYSKCDYGFTREEICKGR